MCVYNMYYIYIYIYIYMSITSHTGMHFSGVSWYSLVTRGTRCAQ